MISVQKQESAWLLVGLIILFYCRVGDGVLGFHGMSYEKLVRIKAPSALFQRVKVRGCKVSKVSEIKKRAINKIADLYFAQWSSGVDPENYDDLRSDGVAFAEMILKEVPELAIVNRKAELPKFDFEKHLIAFSDYQFIQNEMLKAGWVKEITD